MPARAASGPYRTWVTVLCALTPVLTLGIVGMAPSVVLAVGRQRRADIVGAVVIGLMQLALYIEMGLTPKDGEISNLVAALVLIPLWIGTPVHFLVMNQRRFWPAPAPGPAPGYGYGYGYPGYPTPPQPYPAAGPTAPYPNPYQAAPYPTPTPTPTPYPAPAVPAPTPAPGPAQTPAPGQTGAAELRELGELLRRQAGDGQP
ncbi:hypothetical protein [Streptomyces sp. TLI_171]|uniref:hypothetical protein n=1 Tax=Streptomyces sp. TLI_171 TaxID=1938859 RepID=UPI000C19F004|nr:hypothetical protein [Streptomyces sp. TLI_171]RKE20853.1 hypothetical protein BX266_4229 [Streptomyces sp. TLI_171]